MAVKFNLTQAEALNNVIAVFSGEKLTEEAMEETLKVIEHMYVQKTSAKTNSELSKVQKENLDKAEHLFSHAPGNTFLSTKQLIDFIPYCTTTQKAVAIIKILINDGRAIKNVSKGKTFYKLVKE